MQYICPLYVCFRPKCCICCNVCLKLTLLPYTLYVEFLAIFYLHYSTHLFLILYAICLYVTTYISAVDLF
jgi:hypothetical protein